ncbi:MAG: fibronectin [Fidelibacterota bacterium]
MSRKNEINLGTLKNYSMVVMILFLGGSAAQVYAEETKWIAVGDLHNWFSEAGCEIEVGRTGQIRDQQDGLRWPAQYPVQDNQAAKAMWIGATNFQDPVANKTFDYKVVHVGPRFVDVQNETIPMKFELYGRFDHPTVLVDGEPATNLQYMDEVDVVDEFIPADRMLVSVMQTSMGIEVTRKIYAFTNQYHQNYFIFDYVLKNNGIYDKDGNKFEQTLEGVRIFFQYRYAISREGAVYDGNWLPQSAAWGHNTMNDVLGENPDSPADNDQFYSDGEIMRCLYSWHGLHSQANFNNIGGPNVNGDGHLGASQFVGVVTLHADKSASDKTDDLYQPTTTWYVGSDYPITDAGSDQYNAPRMTNEYAAMAAGHPTQSHAEAVCEGDPDPMCSNYPDQWSEPGMQNPGGYSQGQGFGPYTLAPGDSIHIVMAEGAAGLRREMHYEIGANWINDTPGLLPDGSEPANRDEYKNYWVFTGKDSLIQTFKRARDTYNSNYDIPLPPPPPSLFEVNSGGDRIILSWDNSAESWPGFEGYKIFRAIHKPDTSYEEIYDGPGGINSFDDVTAIRGFDYYYYIVSYDDGTANNIQPGVSLVSSKFYTMTNKPASLKRPSGTSLKQIRVVPNPYNIKARDLQYGVGAPDRIMFLDIPPICTIKIFTERGDLVNTIEHTDGSGDETWNCNTSYRQVVVSGLYIAHFETPSGESAIRKFIIIR